MTAALLELLTARANEQQNSPALEMLARLREGGSLPSAPEMMAQLGNTNPMFALLAQQFMRLPAVTPRAVIDATPLEADSLDPETVGELDADLPGESIELAEQQERILALTNEMQILNQRLGLLADALGACGLCWGEDRECRACRGRGRPGYALPDDQLFEELVLPAIRVLRAQRLPRATVMPQRAAASVPPTFNAT
jgi:hypothetical protein